MKVLMVEPGKSPYAAEIESGLKSLQAAVGGDIQAVYPYEDPVALICNDEKYLMLPLYLYDHSGLAMSTESFSGRAPHAEWDSGQVGWIYVSKEDALKEFDADKMTGAIRQKADALMRSEVAAYDSYLHGECYGFELYKNGELSDSCWGFMGNFSDVLKDMAEYLPDECKGMVDHLEEQERPATIIKTLLKHAKIQVDQAAKAFEHASRQQVLGESR